MNRYLPSLAAAVLLTTSFRTQAAPINITAEVPGVLIPSVSAATVLTFDDLPVGELPFYAFDGGTLSGSGAILDSTIPQAAQPFGDTTKYLAVSYPEQTGAVQLLFAGPENYFGLYWGSMDDWNSITFLNGYTRVASFSGTNIAALTGLLANGDQQSFSSNRYVEFDFGDAVYNQVVLATGTFNFEVDNIAFYDPPAPISEPGTLLSLGFALFGVGFMRRMRAAQRG